MNSVKIGSRKLVGRGYFVQLGEEQLDFFYLNGKHYKSVVLENPEDVYKSIKIVGDMKVFIEEHRFKHDWEFVRYDNCNGIVFSSWICKKCSLEESIQLGELLNPDEVY